MHREISNLCRNIAALRIQNGLSECAMAAKIGISTKTLRTIESGILPRGFLCDTLSRIQCEFDIPIYKMFLNWEG